MASTREQAVEVLNSAKLAGDGNAKVTAFRLCGVCLPIRTGTEAIACRCIGWKLCSSLQCNVLIAAAPACVATGKQPAN